MVKNHLKSMSAPKNWPIKRKGIVYITRPNPGPHNLSNCLPISVFMKEVLKIAKTTKEVVLILNHNTVLVNNVQRKDKRFSVGLFDVISFPDTNEVYRIIINKHGKFDFNVEKKENADLKLIRVSNKTIIKKGKTQLNFTDGSNLLIDKNDYKVGETLVYDLKNKKVKEHLKFEKGCLIFLVDGGYIGTIGTLEDISGYNIIVKEADGKTFETKKRCAFVIGKKNPAITI